MASSTRSISICVHASTRPVGRRRSRDVDDAVAVVARDVQHRVHEQVDVETVALEHDAHRVDEERHVVGDDEQDERGECQPSRSRSGDSTRTSVSPGARHAAEREVGDGDGVDVVELAVVDVELGQLGVVQRQERGEHRIVGLALHGELGAAAPSTAATSRMDLHDVRDPLPAERHADVRSEQLDGRLAVGSRRRPFGARP